MSQIVLPFKVCHVCDGLLTEKQVRAAERYGTEAIVCTPVCSGIRDSGGLYFCDGLPLVPRLVRRSPRTYQYPRQCRWCTCFFWGGRQTIFCSDEHRRLESKLSGDCSMTWWRLYTMECFDWMCQICGELIETHKWSPHNPRCGEVDHVVPRSLGGIDFKWNRIAVHRSCNQSKGNTWPVDWYKSLPCPRSLMALHVTNALSFHSLVNNGMSWQQADCFLERQKPRLRKKPGRVNEVISGQVDWVPVEEMSPSMRRDVASRVKRPRKSRTPRK